MRASSPDSCFFVVDIDASRASAIMVVELMTRERKVSGDWSIGQSRQVFACRLIAKDTVEEPVLRLQQQKRSLADAILTADESLLRTLRREDLELLLS